MAWYYFEYGLDFTQWEKIDLEVVDISLKTDILHLVKNTITHTLNILTMCDMKFLENAWELNSRITWVVLDSIAKVTVLRVDF